MPQVRYVRASRFEYGKPQGKPVVPSLRSGQGLTARSTPLNWEDDQCQARICV